jgi:histone deacetylase HOS3
MIIHHGLTHAAIFDFDLHHGDGSQSITWDHNSKVMNLPKNATLSKKTSIGYFSLHDINSYPCEWGDEDKVRNASLCIENAHGQTVWNVHLQPWKTEDEFWKLYNDRYSVLLDKMRDCLKNQNERFLTMGPLVKPKGAIFISAGFDASEWEGQGMQRHKVNVPTNFYAKVTRDIVNIANQEGLGVDGRIISVLEGGYSDRALTSGVFSHICGLASGSNSESNSRLPSTPTPGPIFEKTSGKFPGQTPDVDLGNSRSTEFKPIVPLDYDTNWWSASRLEELENFITPVIVPKKTRPGVAPTYQTPTQSFSAKVVYQPTYQRSISGVISRPILPESRPPSPPPPDVEWTTAAYELAQLIIPQDRQTKSCKPEDLNAKATEARRNRQSNIGVATEPVIESLEKMQLRDRRSKPIGADESDSRPGSRADSNRRKTIGGVESTGKAISNQRRRVSVASTILSAEEPEKSVDSISTRAPSKPRAKKTTKPPVPTVPSAFKQETKPKVNTDGKNPEEGMDDLIAGMKKIRIKLNPPSKELHEKQEAERIKAAESKKPRAPRKLVVKKKAPEIPNMVTNPIPIATEQAQAITHEHVPNITDFSSSNNLDRPEDLPPSFQPPESSTLPTTVTAPLPSPPEFPITGVDPPHIQEIIPNQPSTVTSAPPSMISSPKYGQPLPIFTANGHIPFGLPNNTTFKSSQENTNEVLNAEQDNDKDEGGEGVELA